MDTGYGPSEQEEMARTLSETLWRVKRGLDSIEESQSVKPHLNYTSLDGSSIWEDYQAQFDSKTDLNSWNVATKAIYLAASLQGPAQTVLGE